MKLEISGVNRAAETPAALILLFATAAVGWGQTPASAPAACSKNVSFAVAEGGQPVPASQVRCEMDRQEVTSARLQGPVLLSGTIVDHE